MPQGCEQNIFLLSCSGEGDLQFQLCPLDVTNITISMQAVAEKAWTEAALG